MARAERFYRHVDSTRDSPAARQDGARRDQTTLTAVFGAGRDLFFAHVGHSRAYLFRSGQPDAADARPHDRPPPVDHGADRRRWWT